MRATKLSILAAFLIVGLIPTTAMAEEYVIAAETCVPDHTTLQGDEYTSNVSLAQKTGITGTSQFYCPLPIGSMTYLGHVYATFANTSGSDAVYETNVHLKRISKSTGAISTLKTLSSASWGSKETSVYVADDIWNVTLDYSLYYYVLELELIRPTSPLYTPKIYGIRITPNNP
jgi:hypothetical protein